MPRLNWKKKVPFKLLLLGTGDSGKSTFCKQMQLLHREGFTEDKLRSIIPLLRVNTLDSMKILIKACNIWSLTFTAEEQPEAEKVISTTNFTEEVAKSISLLWKSKAVRSALEQRHRMQLPGGSSVTEYYVENAERFASPDFLPTIPDLLRVKFKTIGISELTFRVSGSEFLMIDVGGQRSERRKWLPLFNDITAIIYLVALNEYEMFLEEDNVTPRLDESLQLFQRLSGSQWLRKASMILFFNKYDIFQERIKERPLKGCFEDYEEFEKKYTNLTELEKSCLYMKEKFISVFNGSRLYMFFTCALDTDNCQKVFMAVRDTIVSLFIDEYEM